VTRVRYWSSCWATSIQSSTSRPVFRRFSQNCEKRLLASSCPSVYLYGAARFQLDGFSWNSVLVFFDNLSREGSLKYDNANGYFTWRLMYTCVSKVKVKLSHYRPGVAQRVGRGIALLFHDRGTRRGRVVSSTPRPHFTPGKEPVPILQEAVWAPGLVWTCGKSRPHRDSIPDRPARSQSLYRLSYRRALV